MPNEKKKVKVRVLENYTHYIHVPKEWIRELGLLFATELMLEKKVGKNPLSWEIRIRPLSEKFVKGSTEGEG